jgi:hypothetical protein
MTVLAAWAADPARSVEWRTEIVDDVSIGGKFSSLRIDKYGNAHVCHVSEPEYLLKYSFWDRRLNKWFTTTVDRTRGYTALALDANNHPHISYLGYGDAQLKHAYWNGSTWNKQPINIKAKDISFFTSITTDADDNASISYYEYWGATEDYTLHLRNVSWNGRFWEVRTVDTTPGSGKFNSITRDSTGGLHLAYANVKAEYAGLRYARWNGTTWETKVLEGVNAPFGVYSVAIAVDKADKPHIVYTDVLNRLVKYATIQNGAWQLQVVDAILQVAYPDRNGIAIDNNGNPYVSYYDGGRGLLKVASRKDQTTWVREIVDQNFSGFNSSLQIHDGTIWLTYADESGHRLKCARRSLDAPPTPAEKTISQSR